MSGEKSSQRKGMPRRSFFKSTGTLAAGVLLVKPETAFGTQANSALTLGILGCGGRGNAVAEAFIEHAGVRVTALADLFEDRFEATRKNLEGRQGHPKITTLFRGEQAYQELARSDVDIIQITTPPYVHPLHLEAALEGGKHVYLEKPVAVDVVGCKKVQELTRKAEGKLSVDVGFQIRNSPQFAELTRRLHRGDIGEIACVQGFYFAGDLPRRAKPGMPEKEARIRNWFFYRALSGDVLVEQNIHIIDVFNWVLKAHPLKASGTGGRKVRTDVGDVWDHFIVTYEYPNRVRASFMSTQFLPQWGSVCERFFGNKGFSEAYYSGGLRIIGDHPWEAGADEAESGQKPEVDPLGQATPEKVKAFASDLRQGKLHNQLPQGVESCLSAILGRQAAYEGTELSWTQVLASDQSYEAEFDLG